MTTKLRAAFMGSPDFAVASLKATHQTCELVLVVTQPDRRGGRGRKLIAPAVKTAAIDLGIPVIQPRKVRDGTLAKTLCDLNLDVIIVAAYGRILPLAVLESAKHGSINVHASILPRWRGAAPIQRAVLAGDSETGVSLMRMEAGLDTGPVFRIARTPIDPHETSGALFERLAEIGGTCLEAFLSEFPDVPEPTTQDPLRVTHAAMLAKPEGRVDWSRPADELVNHIRGMDPWPGAFTKRADATIKLFDAKQSQLQRPVEALPGQVLASNRQGLHVACGTGTVCLGAVQPPGKRRMDARSYVAGRPFAPTTGFDSSDEA
ncbi:MAG: methionyl-tRNA formyltransferase [Nannocystaceae bacterium]